MPLIQLATHKGALGEAKQRLLREITEIVASHVGYPDRSVTGRLITSVEVTELDPEDMTFGGEPSELPRYRILVSVPEGPLDAEGKDAVAAKLTAAILAAEGAEDTFENRHRVWCIFTDVREGNWAAGGKTHRLKDIIMYVLRGDAKLRRAARGK